MFCQQTAVLSCIFLVLYTSRRRKIKNQDTVILNYPAQVFSHPSLPPGCLEEQRYVRLWVMAVFFLILLQSPNLHFTLALLTETLCLLKCHHGQLLPSLLDVRDSGGSSVSHKFLSYFQKHLFCIIIDALPPRRKT